mmetsp:Transcript_6461/g.14100  ORF Transcript_6461/g.14100 Transcript_6461/m.14100 type:complete len:95 (+) Transcript_6461:1282-1566(+)
MASLLQVDGDEECHGNEVAHCFDCCHQRALMTLSEEAVLAANGSWRVRHCAYEEDNAATSKEFLDSSRRTLRGPGAAMGSDGRVCSLVVSAQLC